MTIAIALRDARLTLPQAAAIADEQITYWRTRGCLAPDIARDLRRQGVRCNFTNWPAVRASMIRWLMREARYSAAMRRAA